MTDYFSHFGIPRAYQIDLELLRKSYYSISRSLHPDVQDTQRDAEEIHSSISFHNKAYETLLDPLTRLKYLIEVEGKMDDIEKPLDADFLMTMMEYHEEIESALVTNDTPSIDQLLYKLNILEDEITAQMIPSFTLYDSGDRKETTLSNLVFFFVQLKYLRRLRKALLKEEEL